MTARRLVAPLSPFGLVEASVPPGVVVTKIRTIPQWLALRRQDVTASVAGVLFGDGVVDVGAYQTALRLWALYSGLIEPTKPNKAMRRGQLIEPVILQMLIETYPDWQFVQANRYYSDPISRIGGTPDFFAIDPARPGFGVIDAKSIGKYASKSKWRDADGDPSVPLWIAVQLTVLTSLSGASWAAVAPFHMDSDWIDPIVEIPLRPAVMKRLRPRVADFWRRVEENDPYPPDWNRDAALIAQLYDGADGPILDLGADETVGAMLDARERLKARESEGAEAAEERRRVDAQLIYRLGNAAGARLADGRSFSVKIIRKKASTVEASQYPRLTVKAAVRGRAATTTPFTGPF